MKEYLLALDQGTTSSQAVIYNRDLEIVSHEYLRLTQIYPQQGWVEQNPVEILSSQTAVVAAALKDSQIFPDELAAIGISSQRQTTIIWDRKTGKAVYNAIAWQCQRTRDMVEELYNQGKNQMIQEKTGLFPDAYFSATKIRWILDHVEGAQERAEKGELCFGTVDTWLLWNLTRGTRYYTDVTNASRTMLYNIHTLEWDEELLELFRIPKVMLPEVVPSSHSFGLFELGDEKIPIGSMIGDQQASLVGQACFHVGDTKNTYASGCFLLSNTGTTPVKSENGLLTTIAYGIGEEVYYALEGSVFHAGSIASWLVEEMELIHRPADAGRLAGTVPDTGGVYFVPAFSGLGTPYWNRGARGTVVGMSRTTNRLQLIRAAEESIAYQVRDVVEALQRDTRSSLTFLKVDGGASSDPFILQFQADILDLELSRGVQTSATALGAALLAGLHIGWWKDTKEILQLWKPLRVYQPKMEAEEREALYSGWKRAVQRSLDWEEA